ncbi:MAG TPA: hypothetical protein PLD25_14075 [Chloroflexota bacterium]|nr:hypothetical protein [Chloroflexota bacterium]
MMNQPESSQLRALLQENLQAGGQAMLSVTSNSMSPLIRRGDQVMIVALTRPLLPGDIITFQTDAGLWTHRFWGYVPGTDPPLLLTRGDKPVVFDPPLPAANVLGLVIMRQHHGRWLHLHQGRGLWLNRHLTRLAAWDNRVLTGSAPPQVAFGSQPPRWRQGIHWIFHVWGRLATAVICLS